MKKLLARRLRRLADRLDPVGVVVNWGDPQPVTRPELVKAIRAMNYHLGRTHHV